jgi:hypothetical protein
MGKGRMRRGGDTKAEEKEEGDLEMGGKS